jgi:hypothetical protein
MNKGKTKRNKQRKNRTRRNQKGGFLHKLNIGFMGQDLIERDYGMRVYDPNTGQWKVRICYKFLGFKLPYCWLE